MVSTIDRGDGTRLAYALLPGRDPCVVFLPGFRSDMTGDKASRLARFCETRGQAMLRLDYSGHGASEGQFEDGTIGRWTADVLALVDTLTTGQFVLVGSSMGGWIALLVARARPERISALIGIAAAPDFTERLMWQTMTPSERTALLRDGVMHVPSEWGGPYPITRHLIEEGRSHLLLDGPIAVGCPVRLLHGQADASVPWETALSIAGRVISPDVRVILVKDGDHRLSRPQDLDLLTATLGPLLGQDRP